jgi:hypothetical protein
VGNTGEQGQAVKTKSKRQKKNVHHIHVYIRNVRGFGTSVEELRHEIRTRAEKGEQAMQVIVILEAMHGKNYTETEPTFRGYTLLDQQPAEKEDNKAGRGSGGMLTFLKDDTNTPVQILKKYHTMKECIPICITGKIPGTQNKGTVILAYYIKPERRTRDSEAIYSKMTEMIIELRKKYYVILAGDGNAKLGEWWGTRETNPTKQAEGSQG